MHASHCGLQQSTALMTTIYSRVICTRAGEGMTQEANKPVFLLPHLIIIHGFQKAERSFAPSVQG
jgi:hypothetical protein